MAGLQRAATAQWRLAAARQRRGAQQTLQCGARHAAAVAHVRRRRLRLLPGQSYAYGYAYYGYAYYGYTYCGYTYCGYTYCGCAYYYGYAYCGYFCFQDSDLICGVLDKAWLGDGQKNGLFAILLRDAGCAAAARCMPRMLNPNPKLLPWP